MTATAQLLAMSQDDQAAWHQMMLEQQERLELALYNLAMGCEAEYEINLLADALKVNSPYKRK